MAAHHHQQLPRLNIPPSLNMQQPMGFDGRQPMFSPALPTSLQHSFHPPFPMNGPSLQTPMQPYFQPQPPGAPGRPHYAGHQGHPSIAHMAAAGIPPPSAVPMTPLAHNGFPAPMMLGGGPPFGQQFPQRNRRQQSISLGGPPKAPLGGPGRKHSPLPPAATATPPAAATGKNKKVTINFPQETTAGENGHPATRASWARTPLHSSLLSEEPTIGLVESTSRDPYPPDTWRLRIPDIVDVFLPGKSAWEDIKKRVIEEKLEKLGVERGSGSNVPHIHAPHARAASISSPADPSLLYFKLNKLQQSQTSSTNNSLSNSPQPPFNLSSSPNSQLPPRFQNNKHGHSMSLAQPSSLQSHPAYNPTASFNPFGPNATLGSDQIIHRSSPGLLRAPVENIHAPQGRVPVTVPSLGPPSLPGRADSRPDFVRGFGLDIPEEEEPEEGVTVGPEIIDEGQSFATEDADADPEDNETEDDNLTAAAQSRLHSRHVSRLSAALSLASVGGTNSVLNIGPDFVPVRDAVGDPEVDDLDRDAVGEWTGSEDLHANDETSADESIGEWSNPSDEERARQQRVERRMLRRVQQETEQPRRLPNFPRPPDNTFVIPLRRDDDIVSNPSEEDRTTQEPAQFLNVESSDYYARSPSSGRPLPPLPHSRTASGQLSTHDPALAHSRATSAHAGYSAALSQSQFQPTHTASSSTTMPRRDSLNPFAKPFVFGARQSGSWAPGALGPPPAAPTATTALGHSRAPSFGKPLNVAAPEFKPGGFTFRPPPGVPQLAFAAPEAPRPLPPPPVIPSPPRAYQGREKRQRRGSSASYEDEDTDDEANNSNMSSFRFPAVSESPQSVRRSAPTTPRLAGNRRQSSLNAAAQPFTFSGFSTSLPFVPKETVPLPHSIIANSGSPEEFLDESTTKAPEDMQLESPTEDLALLNPPSNPPKLKRAPIPLDFKHPVSKNTVPAGLFKALINGDERTRRTVRSRLGSREIFEHVQRPSLDDLTVPSISHKASRGRLVTDPGLREPGQDIDDLFSPSAPRRSSLPPALHSAADSSLSGVSIPAVNLTARLEMQRYEQRLESLLDEKIETIRRDLLRNGTASDSRSMNASTEAMITELVSLFRAQLQESAARGLEDSQMDARGELDFELIRDVVEQGHEESRELLQGVLNDVVRRLELHAPGRTDSDLLPIVEDLSNRTVNAVLGAMSQISLRLEVIENTPGLDRDALIRELTSVLAPVLNSLRPEPVDYDALTDQLTQAVKPHISQLIDLASDKRETAGLIVDRLRPLLPALGSPTSAVDTDTIIGQLTAEVRKIIAPIDAFEIKEQVADLVVERLDARLAVRDQTFNVDSVTEKVTEGVAQLLHPMQQVADTLDSLLEGQHTLSSKNDGLASIHKDVLSLLSDLPAQLVKATDTLTTAQTELHGRPESFNLPTEAVQNIESNVATLADGQRTLSDQSNELLSLHQEVLGRLNTLPDTLLNVTAVLQTAHSDFLSSRDSSKQDQDEIRRLRANNTDLQVQLAKARGAHGQVRVEKDNYSEKLRTTEAERDRLRGQIEAAQATASTKISELAAMESRNTELEEALSQALERLKASDVATQTSQERITELERANRELGVQQQTLKSKVDSLELQAELASREKDSAVQALVALQREHDHLTSQQSHWDDLRQVSENIEMLTTLIGQADTEEVKELRRARDRGKALESEYAQLQKRVREHESKAANSDRAANAARQSLVQAQQRSSEWERRAKEYEGKLELTQTKLDQADQTQAQLDADYSLAKLQLEEIEADNRFTKDRESKLHEKVAGLESQVARLEAEAEQARKLVAPPATPTNRKPTNGGAHHPPRPDSRASTVYVDSRVGTPTAQINGLARISSRTSSARSGTPPHSTASVWDSMHAPKRYPNLGPGTPKARHPQSYYRPSIPSPTPSTVSLTPTQGDDGWWS